MQPLTRLIASPLGPLPQPSAPLRALIDFDRALWWSAIVGGAVLLWLLVRYLQNQQSEPAPALPALPATPPSTGFGARVETLRDEIEASGEYRRGCHALARQVREELQSTLGAGSRSLAMTATEIVKRSTDPDLDALIMRLRETRFARAHPGRPKFLELCRDAIRTLDGNNV